MAEQKQWCFICGVPIEPDDEDSQALCYKCYDMCIAMAHEKRKGIRMMLSIALQSKIENLKQHITGDLQ